MEPSIHIDYFISTSSPWTYFGIGRFEEIVRKRGATVTIYPVAFHKVFEVSGGCPCRNVPHSAKPTG